MNITLYDVIYSVRYYPLFSVTTVGLGTYYLRIQRSTCNSKVPSGYKTFSDKLNFNHVQKHNINYTYNITKNFQH